MRKKISERKKFLNLIKDNESQRFDFQNIVSLMTIIVGTNYVLSYRWFEGILTIHGLQHFAIITSEDLTYLFAKYNISILIFTSFGFIGIFLVDFFTPKNINPINKFNTEIKGFINSLLEFKKIKDKIPLIILIILMIILYYKVYKPIIEFPKPILIIIYLVILVGIPFIYYLSPKNRKIIFWTQIFLMFSWANMFINYILEEVSKDKGKSQIELSFDYDNRKIQTNDNMNFIIQSYKYTILSDSNKVYYLYDNSSIMNLKTKTKN